MKRRRKDFFAPFLFERIFSLFRPRDSCHSVLICIFATLNNKTKRTMSSFDHKTTSWEAFRLMCTDFYQWINLWMELGRWYQEDRFAWGSPIHPSGNVYRSFNCNQQFQWLQGYCGYLCFGWPYSRKEYCKDPIECLSQSHIVRTNHPYRWTRRMQSAMDRRLG